MVNKTMEFSLKHLTLIGRGCWRYQIFFLIHCKLSENQIKLFWFFTVILGDLEGPGCPQRPQATPRSPASLGLRNFVHLLPWRIELKDLSMKIQIVSS